MDIPVVERLVQIGGGGFKSDLLALGVPGECAFREVDRDILLSYLPGTMERVPMGLRVVRRRDAFAATVAHSAGASGSVPSWRVIRTVVASSSTMARTP